MEENSPPKDLVELQAQLRGLREAGPAELVTGLLPRLRAMVRKHLPPQSPLRLGLDSEDLMQEGLLQLVKQSENFRGNTWPEFLAFVERVLSQKSAQQARRHTVRRREFESQIEAATLPSKDPTPSVDASSSEDRRRVQKLVIDLPEPYRAAIQLRLEGLDNQSIAKKLGITDEAVRQRLSRAVKMLQDRW